MGRPLRSARWPTHGEAGVALTTWSILNVFSVARYLLNIALHDDEEDEEDEYDEEEDQEEGRIGVKSRLLILEDCDELIAASAKERSGQGLARLLT